MKIPTTEKIVKDNEEIAAKAVEPEVSEIVPEANQQVDPEKLQSYWNEFANARKSEGKNAEFVLLNQEVSLEDGYIIRINLANLVQQPTLDLIRTDLLQFLRDKLKNNQLTIEAQLVTVDSSEMIYTAKEKLNFLSEKYPYVKELQQRLGLDTEY